ncbi:4-alpha-glucanotransferase [Pasteurella multocida]|uniref:4-alpha-glucanotransferase n=1 Tax=Pasteurella multocida TaxID=747 RepID=UPI002CB17C59|nr:4-alpha-glucanotransferase [Pasteurella multocida]MEB3468790.1 4-alpha-glucanotransferase [Pasteurella multocida]MEB3499800.1 4-alpha-glucanotransferase [Pasteurella multocida]
MHFRLKLATMIPPKGNIMLTRSSGVLMHITSLPNPYGIGSFGQSAYDFVDFLVETKQAYWQILPLTTTSYGDSPYQSFSAIAGNTHLIDFDLLTQAGLLKEADYHSVNFGDDPTQIDYERIFYARRPILKIAVNNFLSDKKCRAELKNFEKNNRTWLSDYAEFMAIKEYFDNKAVQEWDDKDAVAREPNALKKYRTMLAETIQYFKVTQYFFFQQWQALKSYANQKGIKIIGDMPIYVAADSVEVWTQPKLFQLDSERRPLFVAGVPADQFSATGQLWGNPLYDWAEHKKQGYAWWIHRIEESFKIYDMLRIDHFKGFSDYWQVDGKAEIAKYGSWQPGPGYALFEAVKQKLGNLPIIAEDLGNIDDKARKLLTDCGYPGMKILQFGFEDVSGESLDSPHYCIPDCIAYTGTHDNDVINGWYADLNAKQQQYVNDYTHRNEGESVCQAVIRQLFATVSNTVIATMQDILDLPASARMNVPSTIGGNWQWRMQEGDLTQTKKDFLTQITSLYQRANKEKNVTTFTQFVQTTTKKPLEQLSDQAIYVQLLNYVKAISADKAKNTGKRKVYYISAEFLIGKLLSNNLINLGIYQEIKETLAKAGKSLSHIEDLESEPSLGNGGLGRLASCFIDSMATLGLNAEGVGLNYHCGLFKQVFKGNEQQTEPNFWIEKDSWLIPTEISYEVPFKDFTLTSKLDRIDILGYKKGTKNYLNLFDIQSVNYNLIKEGIKFDETNIKENLTLFLYPDDSDKNGELLRIYQQYFMVSNAAQLLIDESIQRGSDLHDLADYAYVQINDTHPSMVIPELIRLLTEKHHIKFAEAVSIVRNMVGYTNHTILAEALEKWPLAYLNEVVPHLVVIIKKLDKLVRAEYTDPAVQIIDKKERVHMAHMDIHFSNSVNGVAALHTEILKNSELKAFYNIYPEKFNNKTNGITFRRWLEFSNQHLAAYIKELIGDGYLHDATQLEKLLAFADDKKVHQKLAEIKSKNKLALKTYLKENKGIELDENSIIDTQIKRFHEYKRQQMNALYVIHKYLEIKAGKLPKRKITVIFGGKAAPAYIIAQDIIHLILCLSELINNDPEVSNYLNVYLVENYNVSVAEKLIPATDISEQISLASKEASGTGNMKFMLNGALTLGTMDGANVEIAELAGMKNIYTFGKDSESVIKLYETAGYVSKDYYKKDKNIKRAVDFILNPALVKLGNKARLERLYHELLNKDWFMTLIDFNAYVKAKEHILADYEDQDGWNKKVIQNIAKAGFFSSDRTIAQYNADIWHCEDHCEG